MTQAEMRTMQAIDIYLVQERMRISNDSIISAYLIRDGEGRDLERP